MRSISILAVCAAAMLVGCATAGRPAPPDDLDLAVARGRFVALRSCAGCHDVGGGAPGPEPLAPAFATLRRRYSAASLPPRLAEISRNGHVQMPPIYMTDTEIVDIAAYIQSVEPPVRPIPGLRSNT